MAFKYSTSNASNAWDPENSKIFLNKTNILEDLVFSHVWWHSSSEI